MAFGYFTEQDRRDLRESRDIARDLKITLGAVKKSNDEKHAQCIKDHDCTRKKVKELREKHDNDIKGVHRRIERTAFGGIRFVLALIGFVIVAAVSITGLVLGIKHH